MRRFFSKFLFTFNGLIFNPEHKSIGNAYRTREHVNSAMHKFAALQHKYFGHGSKHRFNCANVFASSGLAFLLLHSVATGEELPVTEVAPGVYAFQGTNALMSAENRGRIANIGFIVGDRSVAVIDTGGSPAEGRELIEAIRSRTDKPISYVINTHMHPDHVFGNAAFVGPDVAFIGHLHLAEALDSRFAHYLDANRATMGDALLNGAILIKPTQSVSNQLTIDLGDRPLEIRAWAASHTDNDLTVFDRKTATLFSGDLVFLAHVPSVDGSLTGWQKAIEELARIPAARVIPGHGPVPSPWPEALLPEQRYFDVIAKDVRAALDAGLPLSEAVKTIGSAERGKWELFDEFNRRNATAAFSELEWE